jgi:hypothetical protein
VLSFLALALTTGGYNQAVATVVKVDVVAAVALAAGWYAHLNRAALP